MKKSGFALIAALVGCVGLAPASFAKGQPHKTITRIEFVGLINDGQLIQIDPMPNRIPDYSSYRLQPIDQSDNRRSAGHSRSAPSKRRSGE